MQLYPSVSVELQLVDRIVNLIDEGVDIALRIGHLTDSSLVARRIGATRRVVVGAPGYLRDRPAPATPVDLDQHRIIASTASASAGRWRFERDGTSTEQEIAPSYITNSAEAAIWHAVRDGGLTQVFGYQVIDHVRAGELTVVLADFEPPAYPIHLVYPTSRLLSAKVRTLIDTATGTADWDFVRF
jgi:DNA-binding transcriptional LysR family regulator